MPSRIPHFKWKINTLMVNDAGHLRYQQLQKKTMVEHCLSDLNNCSALETFV